MSTSSGARPTPVSTVFATAHGRHFHLDPFCASGKLAGKSLVAHEATAVPAKLAHCKHCCRVVEDNLVTHKREDENDRREPPLKHAGKEERQASPPIRCRNIETVVISANGEVFHAHEHCRGLRFAHHGGKLRIPASMHAEWGTRRPCKLCGPPAIKECSEAQKRRDLRDYFTYNLVEV
mmetsp:Transcript_8291/g.27566  ORF Transcript_8291/g.27566 Transcript_8291/m.27566 type:complete len:179 (-) Transcript_8291:90-626(-)